MRLPVGLHPRSHGENVIDDGEARTGGGSSPLTRGKRGARHDLVDCVRLIPAHAGKTVPQGPRRSVSRAHPRSREENYAGASDVLRRNGSSPLTRGKPLAVPLVALAPRLIPAHAGKTKRRRSRRPEWPTHPRSRGENMSRKKQGSPVSGSSPLTRGKRWWRPPPSTRCGLIPAHAGKTVAVTRHTPGCRTHPRSRGENVVFRVAMGSPSGSSPLTRGKQNGGSQTGSCWGLIPAHAGKRCFDRELTPVVRHTPAHSGKTSSLRRYSS